MLQITVSRLSTNLSITNQVFTLDDTDTENNNNTDTDKMDLQTICICVGVCAVWTPPSGGSRISPRRGCQLPGGGGRAPTYNIAKFSRKLHEIERIWVPGGGGGAHPSFPLDLPMPSIKPIFSQCLCRCQCRAVWTPHNVGYLSINLALCMLFVSRIHIIAARINTSHYSKHGKDTLAVRTKKLHQNAALKPWSL